MSNEHLKSLLMIGYFPKELPGVFTTRDFGVHSKDILDDWKKKNVYTINKNIKVKINNIPTKMRGSYYYKLKIADMEILSKPKRGYERRNIHITHPIPQALLAYELSQFKKAVHTHLYKNEFSLDKIEINSEGPRAVKAINFGIHQAKKRFIEASSNWVIKTDITRFYPSIYTHSIPWAMYGKSTVKSKLSIYDGSFADRLDRLVRATNQNQTIGIPIGPETSRILAEIISVSIENIFSETVKGLKRKDIDRLQDDWFIGTESLERSEEVLSGITRAYRDFGLEINGSKTSISHIMAESGTSWLSEINAFLSHGKSPLSGYRLREFLDLTLRLQSKNMNDPIVSYALTIIQSIRLPGRDIESVESFLLKASVLSPLAMDKICTIILNLDYNSNRISVKRVASRFLELAEQNLEKGFNYEAIWQIYTLRGLKFKFSSKKISELSDASTGSVLPLILLDMNNRGLFLSSLPKADWEKAITPETIHTSPIWLLGYEGIRKNWLADVNGVMRTPFFAAMDKRDVTFYDPRRNVPQVRKLAAAQFKRRMQDRVAVASLLNELRGISIGDQDY